MPWRDTRVTKVSIMAAVQVTVLVPSGAEDYGRVTAAMMCLPTTASGVRTAAVPHKFLPTALTVATCAVPSLLYFLLSELVIVRHKLGKTEGS
ncbi:MAG: hypothetical protein ACLP5V_03825 [Candidatus Bathyarchaeia archaeon]